MFQHPESFGLEHTQSFLRHQERDISQRLTAGSSFSLKEKTIHEMFSLFLVQLPTFNPVILNDASGLSGGNFPD